MTQADFDFTARPALARSSDPITSHDAARHVDTNALEHLVLAELRNGPGTTEDLARRLNRSLVTVSPRLKPLEAKGLVRRAGRARNQSGSLATVWEAIS